MVAYGGESDSAKQQDSSKDTEETQATGKEAEIMDILLALGANVTGPPL